MRSLLLLFAFLLPMASSAQIVLQMEKVNSAKTKKFFAGDELTYRIANDPQWYTSELVQIVPSENLLVFDNRYIPLDSITAFRSYAPQKWSKPIAYNLYTFGAAWSLFSLGASVVDKEDPYSWGDLMVTGTAAATGLLIQLLFKKRDYKFGKKRRLRIIDMEVRPIN
jgi:hypothetical protein